MKIISVSVDDETHRLARIRAAETGTTMSAMMREMRQATLKRPAEPVPVEAEPERRARLLGEVLERFKREGIGVDTNQVLTREELYDRNAARWHQRTGLPREQPGSRREKGRGPRPS